MALSLENEEQGSSLSRDLSPSITAVTSGQLRMAAYYIQWAMSPNPRFTTADRLTIERFVDGLRATVADLEALSSEAQPLGSSERKRAVAHAPRDTPEPSSPPEDEFSETTGYIEPLDEPRPARATGEWSDVWSREDRSAKLSGGWEPIETAKREIRALIDEPPDGRTHDVWDRARRRGLRDALAILAELSALPQKTMGEVKLTKAQRAKNLTASLRLALDAVDRCRELLINADADADDLAEYDAAAEGLRMTLQDCLYERPSAGREALRSTSEGGGK